MLRWISTLPFHTKAPLYTTQTLSVPLAYTHIHTKHCKGNVEAKIFNPFRCTEIKLTITVWVLFISVKTNQGGLIKTHSVSLKWAQLSSSSALLKVPSHMSHGKRQKSTVDLQTRHHHHHLTLGRSLNDGTQNQTARRSWIKNVD